MCKQLIMCALYLCSLDASSDCQFFPGLGTRQTDTQKDTQKLTYGPLGTPTPIQSLQI